MPSKIKGSAEFRRKPAGSAERVHRAPSALKAKPAGSAERVSRHPKASKLTPGGPSRPKHTGSSETVAAATQHRPAESKSALTCPSTTPRGSHDEVPPHMAPSHMDSTDLNQDAIKALDHEMRTVDWYHGLMPRDQVEELLKNDGDFLVRKTMTAKKVCVAISVRHGAVSKHVLLGHKAGMWNLRDCQAKTLQELIQKLIDTKIEVIREGPHLVTPIHRPEYYILHDQVELGEKLGGGEFGEVYSGYLKRGRERTPVAIKRLKGITDKNAIKTFLKEAATMIPLDHQNIVRFYGVAPQEEPLMLILELAVGGVLREKLRTHPELPVTKLLKYSIDAARGMRYLSEMRIIHRDIAARNCLLGALDEAKIADFGLSEANKESMTVRALKRMPYRWLAPETLKRGEFSVKTDVWSFAVMIWEIFTRCRGDPFEGLRVDQVKAKVFTGQQQLFVPEDSPECIKHMLTKCFVMEPACRPDFKEIYDELSRG